MLARIGYVAFLLCAAPAVAAAQPRDIGSGLPEVTAPQTDATVRDVRVQVVTVLNTTIGAPMAGRLERFPLLDGERFKEGDVLARFACGEREGALAHAKAAHELKRRVLANKQQLRSLGNSTGGEIDIAAAEVAQAAADVTVAQTMVASCLVTAPFSGRVAGLSVRPYQFVSLGAAMIDILSDHDLEIETIMPSRWLTWLKAGVEFNIAIDETARIYPAAIVRMSGKVDPVSRSVKVYARVTGPADDLLPGMSGRALISPPGEPR